jgi:hypothetical protein
MLCPSDITLPVLPAELSLPDYFVDISLLTEGQILVLPIPHLSQEMRHINLLRSYLNHPRML